MKRLFFLLIIISQPLFAEEYMWGNECDKNQGTMNDCSKEMFKFYDKKLNITYIKVMESLSSNKKNELLAEQRAWLKSRDSDCRTEATEEAEGGSMWPMIYDGCRAESTKERTSELNKWR